MLLSDGTVLSYRLREHPQARHVRIVVSQRAGLVVTIPPGFDRRRIPGILEEKRAWIERALRRYPMRPAPYHPPERIALRAIGEERLVEYEPGNPGRVILTRRGDGLLHVSGAIERPEVVHSVLGRWLAAEARRHLVPWLHRIAGNLGITVTGVSVRVQRTLWGSCSRRDAISLNARLLLIPPELVRYVLIHELMHTKHRNHSRDFWAAVAVHVPDYRTKRVELRRLWDKLEI
jgi:predicted metal-dependent hydrolase